MNINKLTILPQSKKYPNIVFNNPNKDMVSYQLKKAVEMQENKLPKRLVKKIVKERNIPSFVNMDCYVICSSKTKSYSEDAQVLGGYNLNFFS